MMDELSEDSDFQHWRAFWLVTPKRYEFVPAIASSHTAAKKNTQKKKPDIFLHLCLWVARFRDIGVNPRKVNDPLWALQL